MRLIGLVVILAASILLTPLAGDAQQAVKVYRIGVLTEEPRPSVFDRMLPPELRALGWIARPAMADGQGDFKRAFEERKKIHAQVGARQPAPRSGPYARERLGA